MPYYEYECEQCGHVLNRFFPSIPKTIPETVVDMCHHGAPDKRVGMVTFKRILSKTSFHLKGKGWAKDGYKNPTPGMPSGESFITQYRRELADPEHPRKVGDILKEVGNNEKIDIPVTGTGD